MGRSQKIAAFAEEKKVTVCMELLNSKRNHKDYQCDRTAWGAEVCKKVGSSRVKLLYDICHMQVQEGDVSRGSSTVTGWTIRGSRST